MFDSCNPMDCSPPRLLCPWDFSGKNTEIGIIYHWATWEAPRLLLMGMLWLLRRVRLFATTWTAALQASLSFLSWSLLKLMSTESVMPSNLLVLCCPLLLLPSIFPSSRVFSNESALCIRWQKVLECNMGMQNDTITLGTNLKEFLKKLIVHFLI